MNPKNEWLDGTLYPDILPPDELGTSLEREDFICRLCAAWDFGILPESATLAEIKQPSWREVIDNCLFLTSSSYHLLREWHQLPELPYLGALSAELLNDPHLQFI